MTETSQVADGDYGIRGADVRGVAKCLQLAQQLCSACMRSVRTEDQRQLGEASPSAKPHPPLAPLHTCPSQLARAPCTRCAAHRHAPRTKGSLGGCGARPSDQSGPLPPRVDEHPAGCRARHTRPGRRGTRTRVPPGPGARRGDATKSATYYRVARVASVASRKQEGERPPRPAPSPRLAPPSLAASPRASGRPLAAKPGRPATPATPATPTTPRQCLNHSDSRAYGQALCSPGEPRGSGRPCRGHDAHPAT